MRQESWKYSENERLWLAYVRYLKLLGRSEKTALNYFKSINRLDKRVIFTEAKKLDLEEFFFAELERISTATVNNYFISCRVFYGWLVKEDYVASNPLDEIQIPQSDTADPDMLSDAELKALIGSCDKTFLGKRDEAIIRLFSEPGSPRLGEMTALKVSDVDWRHCVVQVTGKTGTRLIPYGNKTANALEKYLNLRARHRYAELDTLWICDQGAFRYGSIDAMLKRRCRKAGIRKIHPHLLRHTAADRAMAAGVSDLDMQTLFGWNGPRMLEVYARSNRVNRALASARRLALGDRL